MSKERNNFLWFPSNGFAQKALRRKRLGKQNWSSLLESFLSGKSDRKVYQLREQQKMNWQDGNWKFGEFLLPHLSRIWGKWKSNGCGNLLGNSVSCLCRINYLNLNAKVSYSEQNSLRWCRYRRVVSETKAENFLLHCLMSFRKVKMNNYKVIGAIALNVNLRTATDEPTNWFTSVRLSSSFVRE